MNAKRMSLWVGLILSLGIVGVPEASLASTLVYHDDFTGGFAGALTGTGWRSFCVASYSNPVLDATRTPDFRYYANNTAGHYPYDGVWGNGFVLYQDQNFSGTNTKITASFSTNTWEANAILFNMQNNQNFYMIDYSGKDSQNNSIEAGTLQFAKVVNGVRTNISTFDIIGWNGFGAYTDNAAVVVVSVITNGSNFDFSIGRSDQPTQIFTAMDTTYSSGGKAGVLLNGTWENNVVADFLVESVPEPVTAFMLGLGIVQLLRRRK